jgi:molybdenum cofactor cytidylyltransferase
MKFTMLPTGEAEGALLAHAMRLPKCCIAKGQRLDQGALAQLRAAGIEQVSVALIEAGDVPEDRAAAQVAQTLVGAGIVAKQAHAGRCNLAATVHGLIRFDPERISALNHIDEAITIATLPLHDVVDAGAVVATVKVNPYAVAEKTVAAWEAAASRFSVAPFRPHRAALIQTLQPGLKIGVLEKTARATRARLEALGSALVSDSRAPHEVEALAREISARLGAGADLVLICGACSIADRADVIPSAIIAAGGRVKHFGMPVDPGNLLLLGEVGPVPVIGMPGCARASHLNGFDYLLRRLLAGLPLESADIMSMGVGGLLREAPEPRANDGAVETPKNIAAVVLAAGRSTRMGANKLLLPLDGKPVLGHVVEAIRAAGMASIIVVLGHEAEKIRASLTGDDLAFALNESYRQGLASSLKCGLAAVPEGCDGAMIFLGDMPDVDPDLVKKMMAAFDPAQKRAIVVPVRGGRKGHPVLWGRRFFDLLQERLSGDSGARHLIGENAEWVAQVEAAHNGIFADLDTPEVFRARAWG